MIRPDFQFTLKPGISVDVETLYRLCASVGARVEYRNLHARHPQLDACTRGKLISLDKSLESRPRAHRCVLAEEIGHVVYPPRPGHISYHIADAWDETEFMMRGNLAVLVAKDERLALKFATRLLIPNRAFWEFANSGPREWQDWLDYFNVESCWFMQVKIGLIRESQEPRKRLKWREIVIRK